MHTLFRLIGTNKMQPSRKCRTLLEPLMALLLAAALGMVAQPVVAQSLTSPQTPVVRKQDPIAIELAKAHAAQNPCVNMTGTEEQQCHSAWVVKPVPIDCMRIADATVRTYCTRVMAANAACQNLTGSQLESCVRIKR